MKPAFVLPLLIALAGCGAPDDRDMVDCRREALDVLPTKHDANDLDDHLKQCMTGRGYHFTSEMAGCSRGDAYQNAACYVR
jgi:hypothetical protein